MYSLDDTIVAIATPSGAGGIGIVRLSGPQAEAIGRCLFRPARGRALAPNHLHYGHILAPRSGRVVDEVLLAFMRAPHTYTRQDVVEINAHGGAVPLREILALCLEQGARLAQEGEFTLRAFLNGRIDLAQAEAVLDIITARTEAALRVAVEQLGGQLSRRVRATRARLLGLLAYLEASNDFPEDELPTLDVGAALREGAGELAELLREAGRGMIYRQGVRAAIVGRPNVGKSSLLNALLRVERAIVTPIPGTTRDTLEETLSLQGIPVVLVDTAGIATTADLVERLGIERSRRAVERAEVVLLVLDGSLPLTAEDEQVAALCAGKPTLVVVNKSDLPPAGDAARIMPAAPHLAVAALSGAGLPALEEAVAELVFSGQAVASDAPLVSNPRHHDLLQRAAQSVAEAQRANASGLPADLMAIDVREAVEALGEITGETASEDLLTTIFSQFCIGK